MERSGLLYRKFVVIILVLVLLTTAFLYELQIQSQARGGLSIKPIWVNNSFDTNYSSPALVDTSFANWSLGWVAAENQSTFGYGLDPDSVVMHGYFSGFNPNAAHEATPGLSGIMIQRPLGSIDLNTSDFPFLVVKHRENSNSSALGFAVSIKRADGTWINGTDSRISTVEQTLTLDVRTLYNGTITALGVMLTSGFDPNTQVGDVSSIVSFVGIFRYEPSWVFFASSPGYFETSNSSGVLSVSAPQVVFPGTLLTFYHRMTNESVANDSAANNNSITIGPHTVLEISARTNNVDIVVRVAIWTSPQTRTVVLLKTYNNERWHTEIIGFNYFGVDYYGLTGQKIYQIEIGIAIVGKQSEPLYNASAQFATVEIGNATSS